MELQLKTAGTVLKFPFFLKKSLLDLHLQKKMI